MNGTKLCQSALLVPAYVSAEMDIKETFKIGVLILCHFNRRKCVWYDHQVYAFFFVIYSSILVCSSSPKSVLPIPQKQNPYFNFSRFFGFYFVLISSLPFSYWIWSLQCKASLNLRKNTRRLDWYIYGFRLVDSSYFLTSLLCSSCFTHSNLASVHAFTQLIFRDYGTN